MTIHELGFQNHADEHLPKSLGIACQTNGIFQQGEVLLQFGGIRLTLEDTLKLRLHCGLHFGMGGSFILDYNRFKSIRRMRG